MKRILPVAIVAVLIAAGVAISTASTLAQETDPVLGSLRGTASRLVEQIIVDGAIVDEIEVPVTDGRIAIPELGIDQPLAADGSFHFSDLPVSADLENQTIVTVIFTAPGLGSYTFEHVGLYPGTGGPILTPQMIDIPRVNDQGLIQSGLPETGGSGPVAGSGLSLALWLLALGGAGLLCAGAATRMIMRSARRVLGLL